MAIHLITFEREPTIAHFTTCGAVENSATKMWLTLKNNRTVTIQLFLERSRSCDCENSFGFFLAQLFFKLSHFLEELWNSVTKLVNIPNFLVECLKKLNIFWIDRLNA